MFKSGAEHRCTGRTTLSDWVIERELGLLDDEHAQHFQQATARRDQIEQAFDSVRIEHTARDLAGRPDVPVSGLGIISRVTVWVKFARLL